MSRLASAFALLVLLALASSAIAAPTAPASPAAQPAVTAPAAAPAAGGAALPDTTPAWQPEFTNPCPPYCLDPSCSCMIYGHSVGGQCVYNRFCTLMPIN